MCTCVCVCVCAFVCVCGCLRVCLQLSDVRWTSTEHVKVSQQTRILAPLKNTYGYQANQEKEKKKKKKEKNKTQTVQCCKCPKKQPANQRSFFNLNR
uniref:Putative secreted protein n=1 Tax=Anopheles darlingi TaxID=43151 RepID=A0A2M4D401_ANODA